MVVCFIQNFFSDNTRVRIFIFFCRAKRKFFFQNSTLDFMTKSLNQIIFFFLHHNQNIFLSNIGNQNIFLEKKHTPFKLNGRSLSKMEKVETQNNFQPTLPRPLVVLQSVSHCQIEVKMILRFVYFIFDNKYHRVKLTS